MLLIKILPLCVYQSSILSNSDHHGNRISFLLILNYTCYCYIYLVSYKCRLYAFDEGFPYLPGALCSDMNGRPCASCVVLPRHTDGFWSASGVYTSGFVQLI